MPDGQDEGLDVVQHPQLGPLKFPKSMPISERNDSIQNLELKTGAGMMTPKAPAPKLPSDAGGESPLSSANAQDAGIMAATQKEYPTATSPKTIASTTGGIIGGGMLGPAAGLLTRSLATGAGMGVGNSVGQLASGENPIESENLQESGGRALMGAGSTFALGGLFKGIDAARRIGETPDLVRGIGRDVASKYVGPKLADAILPEPPPRIGLPEGSSATNMVKIGSPMGTPAGSGAITTSGADVRFGAPPPEVSLPEGSSTTSMTRAGAPMSPPSGSGAMTTTGPPVHFGEIPEPEPELGSPENPGWMAKLPNRMPAVKPEVGSPENPGWVARLPNRMPKIGASGAGRPLLGSGESPEFSQDDLISRTRALVRPGEKPSPMDLKRAGDLTQAPLGRLQALAKWGDELAKNEINRRLQNP